MAYKVVITPSLQAATNTMAAKVAAITSNVGR